MESGKAEHLTQAAWLQSLPSYPNATALTACPPRVWIPAGIHSNVWRKWLVISTCFCLSRRSGLPEYLGSPPAFKFPLLLQSVLHNLLMTVIKHFLVAGVTVGILQISLVPMILLSPLKARRLEYTGWFCSNHTVISRTHFHPCADSRTKASIILCSPRG